ncbi:hypothetical protein [Marinimicrobium sp. C2-29]|uniref:hypothetical protein n=1 Tax=Marinimicrobium sp. C2-29 TaxID=3139825 RepID=UPI003139024A
MAAKFPKTIFFIGALIATSSCAQTASTSHDEESRLLAHLADKVTADLVDLDASIDNCNAKASSRGTVDLEDIPVESDDANKEKLMVGISHLYFDNLFECERAARERLAFSLGTLKSLNPQPDQLPPDIEAINAGLLYPTKKQVEYAVHYQSLPESLRETLEDRVGEDPFELMSTLEKNGLIRN